MINARDILGMSAKVHTMCCSIQIARAVLQAEVLQFMDWTCFLNNYNLGECTVWVLFS